MRKQNRLLALVMSLFLLLSVFPVTAFADQPDYINIKSDWQGSVFGDVGGADKIVKANFGITENQDGTVTLMSANDRGKIQGGASAAEGIAYYYKAVAANANFELSAKVTVDKWTANNQVAFGLMLRSNVLINENKSGFSGDYVALGALDQKIESFYKQGVANINTPTKFVFNTASAPSPRNVYDLSIKKSGNALVLKVGNETQIIDNFTGNITYAGLFTSRNTTVTFSNVNLKVDSRVPTKVTADSAAMTKEYFVGDNLDLTGLKVTAEYSDGHKDTLAASDYIVTGFDNSKQGKNTITVNFNGVTAPIDLTIKPLVVTALDIKYYPAKTVYTLGDKFDPQGLTVLGEYNGGPKKEELSSNQYSLFIDGATVTGSTYLNTAGTVTVKINSTVTATTYASFDVTVKNVQISGLEIRQLPEKTLYFIGDKLDIDGMVVYAKYNDNSQVRLLRTDYTVAALDSATAGSKQIKISYKGKDAYLPVTVKVKDLLGIKVTKYPKTTYEIGQDFDKTGLEVSKVYDNMDTTVLAANQYTIDSSSLDKTKAGTYNLKIVPSDNTIQPITFKVTVRPHVDYQWKSIRFGQSSSDASNKVTINNDGTVKLEALEGGGKVTGDHDGISFYYTEIDAVKDNFVISADIKVVTYAKEQQDGQESFGVMARDAIGKAGDSSVFASNIAAIGGYSGATTAPNGTQLFVRTGVTTPDGAGSKGIQKVMLNNERPTISNTYPAKDYKLTLAKTNTGYTGKLNNGNGTDPIFFEPDILNVQDSKIYVGFYTARLATIEVSNLKFTVTATESDAPKVEAPKEALTPQIDFVSLDKTSNAAYTLGVKSNVVGTVTIKQGQTVIAQDQAVIAGKVLNLNTTVTANTYTNFSASFVPDDTQNLTSFDKIVKNFTVNMKTYVDNGDIYVSPTGSSTGNGTINSPLNLDTAIDYVKAGQKIILQDGKYVRSSKIEIKKGNDGTATAKKYLVAAPGAKPVIDFDKKSEGVVLSGNYWHIKGIDFARTAANTKGFTVGGSYNTVELSRFYENGDTGLQISRTDDSEDKALWPSYNLILNSESFDNRDPSENNADGFAAKLTAGVGNIFRGCIAHNNIDDGWDLYTKAGTGAIGAVIIENSIAYNNGTLTDGTVGSGDKNGFKLGGEGIRVPHIIRNSIAFGNGAYGFTSNSNPGVIAEKNNVSYNNVKGNLSFTTYINIPTDFKINGFVSYQKNYTVKDSYPAELSSDTNYLFNGTQSVNKSGVKLTDANFASLQPVLPYQRDAAGNIIFGDFLKFSALTAPTGLATTSGITSISLNWGSVTGATYYNVYRSADNTTFTKVGTASATSYIDNGLNAISTYYYKVSAANVTDEGFSTSSLKATTLPFPSSSSSSGTSGSSGGSTPIPQPTNTGSTISVESVKGTVDGKAVGIVKLDTASLSQAISALTSNASKIVIEVKGNDQVTVVQVQAPSISDAASKTSNAVLSIKANGVTYDLPAKALNVSSLAKSLGVDVKDMKLNITIEKVNGTIADAIAANAKKNGVTSLVGAVDFNITAEANGKKVTANDFGKTYVARSFDVSSSVDTKKATGVMYNPTTGTLTFVPTRFTTNGSTTTVTIMRPGNSIYTVVQSNKTFADLEGHWAKADVELLASKLLVNGSSETTFAPQDQITRAEFAALLVRATGLTEEATTKFSDVKANDWFAGAVGAASTAGLVDGFENGTFQPAATITREQMAVMITRAIEFTGKKGDSDAKKLAAFQDSSQISGWAKDAAAAAINAGIVNGTTDTTFTPSGQATRAEAAVMLKRLLLYVGFMN